MGTLLFVPLTLIAFFESTMNTTAHQRLKEYFSDDVLEDEDDPDLQDPKDDDENGDICKVKFEDLVKVFPKCVSVRAVSLASSQRFPLQYWLVSLGSNLARDRKVAETNGRVEANAGKSEWESDLRMIRRRDRAGFFSLAICCED